MMPCQPGPTRRLSDEASRLALKHIGLAIFHAKPWIKKLPSLRDEFMGAAYVGLCLAARDWDPAVGGIGNYIKVRVNSECRDVRRQFRRKCRTATGKRVGGLLNVIGPPARARPEERELAAVLLRSLPRQDAKILRSVVMLGRTRREVGRRHGRDGKTVGKVVAGSLARLRWYMLLTQQETLAS